MIIDNTFPKWQQQLPSLNYQPREMAMTLLGQIIDICARVPDGRYSWERTTSENIPNTKLHVYVCMYVWTIKRTTES